MSNDHHEEIEHLQAAVSAANAQANERGKALNAAYALIEYQEQEIMGLQAKLEELTKEQ